jgi:predicted nucleic acid-binding protein
MTMVLVDTSVWVGHFREHNPELLELMVTDKVLGHPMVLGEVACGTPPNRAEVLANLRRLQPAQHASMTEVVEFISREHLFGKGCGLVDVTLLASTLMTTGAELWSWDKRLAGLAQRFGVLHQQAMH